MKKLFLVVTGLLFMIAFAYLLYAIAVEGYTSFLGATDTIKAAVIAALVSVVALFLGDCILDKPSWILDK